jgi:hypothetical protein
MKKEQFDQMAENIAKDIPAYADIVALDPDAKERAAFVRLGRNRRTEIADNSGQDICTLLMISFELIAASKDELNALVAEAPGEFQELLHDLSDPEGRGK